MGSLAGTNAVVLPKQLASACFLRRPSAVCLNGLKRISISRSTRRKEAVLVRALYDEGEFPKPKGMESIMHGRVDKFTVQDLEKALLERKEPMIIDFYATWCGPCLLLSKELEEVAREMSHTLRIIKIDADLHPELSSQLQISGLPTMIFVGMDKQKPALRTEGLMPANVIMEIVEKELTLKPEEAKEGEKKDGKEGE